MPGNQLACRRADTQLTALHCEVSPPPMPPRDFRAPKRESLNVAQLLLPSHGRGEAPDTSGPPLLWQHLPLAKGILGLCVWVHL